MPLRVTCRQCALLFELSQSENSGEATAGEEIEPEILAEAMEASAVRLEAEAILLVHLLLLVDRAASAVAPDVRLHDNYPSKDFKFYEILVPTNG